MTDEPDDLDAILAPSSASLSPGLHDAILVRIEREFARRRTFNRLAKAGALTAVLGLGFLIGHGTRSRPVDPVPADLKLRTIVVPVLIPILIPAEQSSSQPLAARSEPDTASQAELLAEQSDDRAEAGRLYRLAGDRFLNDAQDYRNAARCYRLYLDRAGEGALTPSAADTWLLTSLKNSLFKEKFNVAKTDG